MPRSSSPSPSRTSTTRGAPARRLAYPSRRLARRAGPLAALALLLAAAACRDAGSPGQGTPLLDGLHAPDVLTESRRLATPPATDGNRLLHGWRTWRRKGTVWWVPEPEPAEAHLEVVTLEPRPRRLVLANEIFNPKEDFSVGVRVDGRELPAVPLASPLEIELPAGLPAGRLPVTLTFPEQAQVGFESFALAGALPPGEVEFEGDRIVQSGVSAVDFVRRLEGPARLRGRFLPPDDPRPEQRFTILLETGGGEPAEVFAWQPGWRDLLGGREIEAELPPAPGFVRVRLLATGRGPAASWAELRIAAAGDRPPAGAGATSTSAAGPARGETGPPPPAPPRLVVVYVLDALRADYLTHLGGPAGASPELDRLADRSATFTRHQSVAPNTLPSTKSLFTGQAFVERGHAKLPEDGPGTVAEVFAAAGYRTAAFSGNGYVAPTYGTARGFEHLARDVVFADYPDRPGAYNDNAARVHRRALAWLDGLAPGERAFLYLHTIHPHNPYDPPDELARRFTTGIGSSLDGATETLLSVKHNRIRTTPADRERLAGLYAGALAYNDALFPELLAELAARVPPEETLLVVTSDHGEELFDHGGVLHGYTLYGEQLEIPLVMHWPGRIAARRIDAATDNLDLHETLRALVGAPPSGAGDGRSLWPLLAEPTPSAAGGKTVRLAAASSVKGGIFLAQSERYKLILAPRTGLDWGMGEGVGRSRDPEYVFDLAADPGENENLAGRRSLEVDWLRSRLGAWIESDRLRETGAEEAELDEEARERLRALGYLE